MDMEKFETGDVVYLKSGGPAMTVQSTNYPHSVTCSWFDGKQVTTNGFRPETLTKKNPCINQESEVSKAAKKGFHGTS